MVGSFLRSLGDNRERLVTRLFAAACALVAFALPFSIRFSSKAILFLLIAWLFHVHYREVLASFRNRLVWLFILPYFLSIFSLAYTTDLKGGLWELEKASSLLLFPILFFSVKPLARPELRLILRSFIYSNLLFGIIALAYATYMYFAKGIDLFYNFDLVNLFRSHPTYYSMYILFSIAALFNLHQDKSNANSFERNRLAVGVIVVFFSVLIFLLSVRFIFLISVLACLFLIVFYTKKTRNFKAGVFLLLAFALLIVIALGSNDVLRERLMQIRENYTYQLSPDHIEGYNGFTTRLAQWESSLSIIRKSPLIGIGPADVQDELQKVYKKNFLKYSYRDKLNAHNQYVQTTLGLGFVGLLVFVASLVVPAVLAFRQRNYLVLSFLLLFSLCCITESMLYVHKGIVFFSFFNSFFTFHLLQRNR